MTLYSKHAYLDSYEQYFLKLSESSILKPNSSFKRTTQTFHGYCMSHTESLHLATRSNGYWRGIPNRCICIKLFSTQ